MTNLSWYMAQLAFDIWYSLILEPCWNCWKQLVNISQYQSGFWTSKSNTVNAHALGKVSKCCRWEKPFRDWGIWTWNVNPKEMLLGAWVPKSDNVYFSRAEPINELNPKIIKFPELGPSNPASRPPEPSPARLWVRQGLQQIFLLYSLIGGFMIMTKLFDTFCISDLTKSRKATSVCYTRKKYTCKHY